MKDSSLTISVQTASELIALGLVGVMTEATYTELMALLGSAKITDPLTSQDGSENSSPSAVMLGRDLERLFIRGVESQMPESSTPLSPSGCLSNSSRKQDTNDS